MARARVFVTPEWIASVETKPWRSKAGEERLYINDWQPLVGLRMELDEHGKWHRAFFGSEQIERAEYRKASAAKAYVVGNMLTVEGSTSTHITDGIIAAQMQAAVARSAPKHVPYFGDPTKYARTAVHDGAADRSYELADAMFDGRADVDAWMLLARFRARMDAVDAQFTGDAIALHASEAIWKTITEPKTDRLPWDRDSDPGGPQTWDLRASEDLAAAEVLLDCRELVEFGIQATAPTIYDGERAALTAVLTAVEHLVRPTDGSRPAPATRRSVLDWLDTHATALDEPATQRWWPGYVRDWMTRSGGLPPEPVPVSEVTNVDELEWLAVAARETPRAKQARLVLGLLVGDGADARLSVPVEWVTSAGGVLPRFRPEPLPTTLVGDPAWRGSTPLLLSDERGFDSPTSTQPNDSPSPAEPSPVPAAPVAPVAAGAVPATALSMGGLR